MPMALLCSILEQPPALRLNPVPLARMSVVLLESVLGDGKIATLREVHCLVLQIPAVLTIGECLQLFRLALGITCLLGNFLGEEHARAQLLALQMLAAVQRLNVAQLLSVCYPQQPQLIQQHRPCWTPQEGTQSSNATAYRFVHTCDLTKLIERPLPYMQHTLGQPS